MARVEFLKISSFLLASALMAAPAAAQSKATGADAQSQAISDQTLSRIAARGEFVLGHRESTVPFSYIDAATKTPTGYTVDICRRIYERVKLELKRPDLKLRYSLVEGKNRISDVKSGVVDVECGATTITAERQKDIDFSYTFFVAGTTFMVKKDSGISNIVDLRNKRVAVAAGTTTERQMQLVSSNDQLNIQAVPAKDAAAAFALFANGQADAVISEDAGLWGFASNTPDPSQFKFLARHLSQEPYGIGFAKNSPQFSAMVDQAMLKVFESGEALAMFDKWFVNGPGVKFPFPKSPLVVDAFKRPSKFSPL